MKKDSSKETKLRKLQKEELKILDEIVRICDKHQIDYFLVGGTCLGALRHKGFIPWDDDIDIAMAREDYEKFIEIAIKEIDNKYFVQCNLTDPNYYLGFIKIRKNNTSFVQENFDTDFHQGFFVDIFPLDYTDNIDSLSLKINVTLAKNLTETALYKRGYKLFSQVRHPILSVLGLPFSIKTLQKKINSLMQKHNNREHKYIGSFAGAYHYKKDSFPIDKVFPASFVEFEGKQYKTFNDPKWYMEHLYGDYMKLPPKEKRVNHNPSKLSFTEGKTYISYEEYQKNQGEKSEHIIINDGRKWNKIRF